ncbi:MAG TPA: SUMF1/EgtB/PvdO family nonheme iron enzyme [Thermoanaerobaculia bacterium]|nr:SUMF1/EgtB/PvdO family nonheme iron enzyme [Thermoanaerobaculia bacterium]
MKHPAFPNGITREALVDWYRAIRVRTKSLFDIITPDAYYDRPIALRNPIVFYEGHLPAFAVNTLVKLTQKREGIDARLEDLFARGIDPESEDAIKDPTDVWPSRADVQAYNTKAEQLIEETLAESEMVEATFTILEHELMHQETLLYMLHQLPYEKKSAFAVAPGVSPGKQARNEAISIPRGRAILGAPRDGRFGWDNEFPELTVDVDAFTIDAHNVTNGEYLEFLSETGASAPHFWDDGHWRGLFERIPLPLDWPVYVTHEQAEAYARWRGARLPTEAEFHRALGDEPIGAGNYDFLNTEPVPVGSYEPNALGIYDLAGNGWEWTSTLFEPFPGFEPMPSYLQYSADFFDGKHYVMKGASPATARELLRPSFRNWFRPNYPYVYATFRTVR